MEKAFIKNKGAKEMTSKVHNDSHTKALKYLHESVWSGLGAFVCFFLQDGKNKKERLMLELNKRCFWKEKNILHKAVITVSLVWVTSVTQVTKQHRDMNPKLASCLCVLKPNISTLTYCADNVNTLVISRCSIVSVMFIFIVGILKFSTKHFNFTKAVNQSRSPKGGPEIVYSKEWNGHNLISSSLSPIPICKRFPHHIIIIISK